MLDSGLSLAVAAAVTSSIAVGYAIYVPSLRPLAWAAKQVAGTPAQVASQLAAYAEAGADPPSRRPPI